jgi:hypothetical protein
MLATGQNRNADRGDGRHTSANERSHQIDVVDHQVEHHRDIRAARIERREPVTLDEPRAFDVRQGRANCSVEPLDVSGLNQGTSAFGNREEIVRLLE